MIRIATWNVNSVRARLPCITEWLKTAAPDVVLLQETKCLDKDFPYLDFAALGYNHTVVAGQKSYNGVAILANRPISDPLECLPGEPADQARYIEGSVDGLRVASVYVPNGNPVESEKYPYKLRFLSSLRQRAETLLETEQPLIFGGDYNVIPEPIDVYRPESWVNDALFRIETRQAFRAIEHLGLTDAFRAVNDQPNQYTFWDYFKDSWERDRGLRIDHFLVSAQAIDRLSECRIDKGPRAEARASDHTPVILELRT